MTGIIKRVFYKIKREKEYFLDVYRYYKAQKLTDVQKQFARNLTFLRARAPKEKSNGIVLVALVMDYEYVIKFGAASKVIAEKNNLSVRFYEVDINWIWKTKRKTKNYETWFHSPLDKMHLAYGDKILFRNSEKYKDQDFIKARLNEILCNLNKKEPSGILELKFDGIPVGDLIYDTYLRFFHQPTLEKIDNDVILTIEIALNVFYNFKAFLQTNNIQCILNTYTSYIHHGIPARLCLEKGIDVYTLGSHYYIAQKVNKDFPYHHIDYSLFSPDKKLTESQLESAKEKLTSRFSGEIDRATSYMRQSTYTRSTIDSGLKKLFQHKHRNVIVYTHDFYDSPHVNRMLQFPDLFTWLKKTLEVLADLEGLSVFIKIHPNGMEGCKEKTIELVNSFKVNHFHVLDESVSNLHIVELKPDLIVTARGTVGVEMAWFEIPTVALFDNPYTNFNFVHTCHTKEEYFAILRGEKQTKIDFDKKKIYSFYYQAFIEKAPHQDSAFSLLQSFNGGTYNDEYLKFINSHAAEIFSKEFIEYYSNVL